MELLPGKRPEEEPDLAFLFDEIRWVGVDDALAERAGSLTLRFQRSHPGIGAVDMVIAATTQQVGAQLWTPNVRHFPMFPDLAPPY